MEDGVLGHLGHPAAELVVVGADQEENIAIIHHPDMVGQIVMVQEMKRRDAI